MRLRVTIALTFALSTAACTGALNPAGYAQGNGAVPNTRESRGRTPLASVAVAIDARSPALATVNKDVFGANLASSMNLTKAYSTYPAMMAALQGAHFGMVRWPLGSLSDYYHWKTNSFSSCVASKWNLQSRTTFDQFVQQIVQPLGLDVNITVNYGSNATCTSGGSPDEAAAWVDYANNHMHYGIKHWSIGNEMYWGSPTVPPNCCDTVDLWAPLNSSDAVQAQTYARLVSQRFYPMMKAKDPTIQVGIDLAVPTNKPNEFASSWDAIVLKYAKYDFVEVHWYGVDPPNVPIGDDALITAGASYFASSLAAVKSELAAAGKPNTPVFVGEWGLPGNDGSPQAITIVGALYTAEALGEMLKGGIGMGGIWEGFNSGPCITSQPGDYGWQKWYTPSLFEAISGGTNPACPSYPQPPYGTPFARADALAVVHAAFRPGDKIFSPNVSTSLSGAQIYGARRTSGYGLLVVNTRDRVVKATVTLANDSRAFAASSVVYDKALYDESKNSVWAGPISKSLGSAIGKITVLLPPWSATAITLAH